MNWPRTINWQTLTPQNSVRTSASLGFTRACPICQSLNHRNISELENFQFYSDSSRMPKHFTVKNVQCLDCFLVFMNPCYSDFGFSVLFNEAGKSYGSLATHTDEQISWLEQKGLIADKSVVLDVGCYDGAFLSKLPNNVIKYGVDIDLSAIELGREKYQSHNFNLICESFNSVDLDGIAPDTITMYHVLEHLSQPVAVLKRLRKISHERTKIVIEIPVVDNGNTNDIHGFFSIQHTMHFSRASLKNCLKASGWKLLAEHRVEDYNGLRVIAEPCQSSNIHTKFDAPCMDWSDIADSLASWKAAISNVERKIQEVPKNGDFVIWGGGVHTEYLYHLTSLFHARKDSKFVIVDSDPQKRGKCWRGIEIISPNDVPASFWREVIAIISSYGSQAPIEKDLLSKGMAKEKIFKLYDSIRRY